MREMKWHVFNKHNQPLTWDGEAIEFDTEKDAKHFVSSCIWNWPNLINDDIEIKNCIFFYDGGHINLSGYIVDEDGELAKGTHLSEFGKPAESFDGRLS